MQIKRWYQVLRRMLMVLTAPFLLYCCASSSLTATWHDQSYAGNNLLRDVLVIAVTEEETSRRLYEDGFVTKLSESGVRGIPSYSLQNSDIEPTKQAVQTAVTMSDARYVLITRHLSTDEKQHYSPPEPIYVDPYYSRMHRYYPLAYREVRYRPGYTYTVTTVSIESNLYDAKTEKLIWSAQSKSVDPNMSQSFFDGLVDVFTKDLKEKKLL
ncbi:MAG: hypothetical protein HKN69_10960 [Desulfofustis sp.]|nr:hypothetical protein [Desulfofustis sp.]